MSASLPAGLKQPGSPLVGLALAQYAMGHVINAQMLWPLSVIVGTEHLAEERSAWLLDFAQPACYRRGQHLANTCASRSD